MRNLIIFIIFLIFSFFINVVFYYVSPDYRDLLKNIKKENVIKMESNLNDKDEKKFNSRSLEWDKDIWIVKDSDKNSDIFDKSEKWNSADVKDSIVLWKNYRDVLDLFSSYDLQRLEINTSLFDVTNEYPDNYIEYYSKDLTVYFFPTKTYSQVYDIFKVLEYELPFTLNNANNFWEKTFYINLNKDIDDNITRLVVSHKWIAFWIKTKKSEYNLVREKLNLLKDMNSQNTESGTNSGTNLESNIKKNEQ